MEDGIPGGLQHCPKMCCGKDSHCGRWACMITPWRCNFWMSGLAYNNNKESCRNHKKT